MYWLRNPHPVVRDLAFLRDARGDALVWKPAGTSGCVRPVEQDLLSNPHVVRALAEGAIVPDPVYDAQVSERGLEEVRSQYAKVFRPDVSVPRDLAAKAAEEAAAKAAEEAAAKAAEEAAAKAAEEAAAKAAEEGTQGKKRR